MWQIVFNVICGIIIGLFIASYHEPTRNAFIKITQGFKAKKAMGSGILKGVKKLAENKYEVILGNQTGTLEGNVYILDKQMQLSKEFPEIKFWLYSWDLQVGDKETVKNFVLSPIQLHSDNDIPKALLVQKFGQ